MCALGRDVYFAEATAAFQRLQAIWELLVQAFEDAKSATNLEAFKEAEARSTLLRKQWLQAHRNFLHASRDFGEAAAF